MADSNENPPPESPSDGPDRPARLRPGPLRHGRGDRRRPRQGDRPDRRRAPDGRGPAEAAVGRRPRGRTRGRAERLRPEELRRRPSPRGPRSDRVPVPRSRARARRAPGPRTGKVIGVRGKTHLRRPGRQERGGHPGRPVRGRRSPQPGSTIEVVVDRFDPGEGIQHPPPQGDGDRGRPGRTSSEGVVVEARVTKVIKGGVEVDVDGIRGFMPISQIDLSRVEDAASLRQSEVQGDRHRGQRPREEPRRLPPRAARAGAGRAAREDLGHARGRPGPRGRRSARSRTSAPSSTSAASTACLPIGEMSWSRVAKVDDLVKIGDKVTVKVLKIDQVARKLTLGLKQLTPSPWEGVARQVSPRHDGQGQGHPAHGLRRLRRARAGRRGPDPHLGAVADRGSAASPTSSSPSRRSRSASSRSSPR